MAYAEMIAAACETLVPKSEARRGSIGSTARSAMPPLALASASRKMTCFRTMRRVSVHRRPAFAHHLAPLVVVGLQVGAELRRRVRVGRHAGGEHELVELVGAHQLRDLAVQLGDDVRRGAGRSEQADPHGGL